MQHSATRERTPELAYLESEMKARNQRRGLSESVDKLDHAMSYMQPWLSENGEHLLFVGVGQGHDALHALLCGGVERITGVDPYIDEDGNDSSDYESLLALVERCKLEERCDIHKNTLQEFALGPGLDMSGRFSMIVIPCTLHHIFETSKPLSRSELLPDAIDFFRSLHYLLRPGGVMVIFESVRRGLRPMLKRFGLIGGAVDYSTKQGWSQWRAAAEPAGFALRRNTLYTPYALRRFRAVFDTPLGVLGPSDRYFSIYTRD